MPMCKRLPVLLVLALVVLLLIVVAGCGQEQPVAPSDGAGQEGAPAQQEQIRFKFAHYLPLDHFASQAAQVIVDEIDKNSDGRIKVDFFPAEALYKSNDLHEAVRNGDLEMGFGATSYWADVEPATAIFDVPFLFPDFETAFKATDGEVGQEFGKLLEKYGVKVIGYMHYGFMDGIGNNVRPIKSPADIKGLKIRTFGFLPVETFKVLGASPTAIASGETYTALQRGTVDGAQSGISSFVSRKWSEVLKYTTVLPMSYIVYPMMVNMEWWDTVPPDLQQIIVEAVQKGADYTKQAAQEDTEKSLQALKDAGVEVYVVPTEELDQWKEATKPVWDTYIQTGGEAAQKLLDLAQQLQ